jgi:hypothetical protein
MVVLFKVDGKSLVVKSDIVCTVSNIRPLPAMSGTVPLGKAPLYTLEYGSSIGQTNRKDIFRVEAEASV